MKKRDIKIKIYIFVFLLFFSVFVYSFFFYSSEKGIKSVYRASFDWKIDLLATISGIYVLSVAIYLFNKKKITLFPFVILCIIGSTQSMMHIAKWIVRVNFVPT